MDENKLNEQQNNEENSSKNKKPKEIVSEIKQRYIENKEQRKEETKLVKSETEKVLDESLQSIKQASKTTDINDLEIETNKTVEPPTVIENKKGGKKKFIFYAFFITICVSCLVFTAFRDFQNADKQSLSFGELFSILGAHWYYVIFALLSALLLYFFDSFKISLMLKTFTGKWNYKLSLHTSVLTKYYDNITPFASGGQPFAIYSLNKNGVKGGVAAAIPVVAIFVMQVIFVIMSIGAVICDHFAVFSSHQILSPATTVMAIIGIVMNAAVPVAVIIFSSTPKIGVGIVKFFLLLGHKMHLVKEPHVILAKTVKAINNYITCMKAVFSKHKLMLLGEFVASLFLQIANCSIIFFTLKAFGYDDPNVSFIMEWITLIVWSMILYCVVSFIPTPGNSGATEVSFSEMFSFLLVQTGLCFSATIMWRLLCFYMVIIIGAITVNVTRMRKRKNKKLSIQI